MLQFKSRFSTIVFIHVIIIFAIFIRTYSLQLIQKVIVQKVQTAPLPGGNNFGIHSVITIEIKKKKIRGSANNYSTKKVFGLVLQLLYFPLFSLE